MPRASVRFSTARRRARSSALTAADGTLVKHRPRSKGVLRGMATLEPVRVVYCTVCGLPPEFCEYNTDVPHPASAQDAPAAGSSGVGGGAANAQQALAALSLAGTGEAPAGGASAELVRDDGWRVLPHSRRCPDASRARLPQPRVAQKARTQRRPRRARKAARSLPRNRFAAAARCSAAPSTLPRYRSLRRWRMLAADARRAPAGHRARNAQQAQVRDDCHRVGPVWRQAGGRVQEVRQEVRVRRVGHQGRLKQGAD